MGLPRISHDPALRGGGKPCIRGIRITMGMIIELIGNCSERALQAHSLWETADIDLALTFAAGRLEEREDVLAGPELKTRLMVVMSHTVSLNLKGLVLSESAV